MSAAGAGGDHRARLLRNAEAGQKLADHAPELHKAYWRTHRLAMAPGAIDHKTKELIGLALVVTMQCDVCVSFHVRDCIRAGCTREEMYDALNVALMQGSGPAMVYAGYAVEAIDEYLADLGAAPSDDERAAHRH